MSLLENNSLNSFNNQTMPDVQGRPDTRRIAIDHVGVRDVRHPALVSDRDGVAQRVEGRFRMGVELPATAKGTHMSRFLELLSNPVEPFSVESLGRHLDRMVERLDARAGRLELNFRHFLEKRAPVTGTPSLLDYDTTFSVEIDPRGARRTLLKVVVPVTSLCPCSKEISERGAHNQRSHITVVADLLSTVWIEEIAKLVEQEASCELFGLLKRPDEKWVTERAYDNPKFVEDLVRDVAAALDADARIDAYVVETENFESIHNHSAYALIERDKLRDPRP
jgi:GTP cyclohydrolase I